MVLKIEKRRQVWLYEKEIRELENYRWVKRLSSIASALRKKLEEAKK